MGQHLRVEKKHPLWAALNFVKKALDEDESRPALNYLNIERPEGMGEGKPILFIATDGRRLHYVTATLTGGTTPNLESGLYNMDDAKKSTLVLTKAELQPDFVNWRRVVPEETPRQIINVSDEYFLDYSETRKKGLKSCPILESWLVLRIGAPININYLEDADKPVLDGEIKVYDAPNNTRKVLAKCDDPEYSGVEWAALIMGAAWPELNK